MLKHLHINNIVLVESSQIPFKDGFNALSGETGSGKSAIMGALTCLMGSRADTSIIRRDADKGTIEATFEISHLSKIRELLENAGISHDEGEDLIIKREISSAGKSRAFVNNQMAQISLLRQIGEGLLQIVGQHANQRLLHTDHHRDIIDNFGGIETAPFEISWKEEIDSKNELQDLLSTEAQRLRNMETMQKELSELDEAHVMDGEEEELFSEYTLLNHSEELSHLSLEITNGLSEDDSAILPNIKKIERSLEKAAQLDPALKESYDTLCETKLELLELERTLLNYQSKIDHNPQRIEQINERLSLLNKIKKKYGPSVSEYHKSIQEKLTNLAQSDDRIHLLKEKIADLEKNNNVLAQELSKNREKIALQFEKDIENELRALNMPKAKFFVEIHPQKRNKSGDDNIEFFFMPNVGEKKISIKDCASGGELSRLMLAIQTMLAGKEKTPTLIFDEIDANIGGETANVIGEKLQQIGMKHQVLCITHFPQVAKCAIHHLQISKSEKNGRTITTILPLEGKARETELKRMHGEALPI